LKIIEESRDPEVPAATALDIESRDPEVPATTAFASVPPHYDDFNHIESADIEPQECRAMKGNSTSLDEQLNQLFEDSHRKEIEVFLPELEPAIPQDSSATENCK
jgi:hypothetical protein